MIRETSLLAYMEIRPVLNNRQIEVLEVIKRFPNSSDLEIAQILGLPINSVTPRRLELEKKGLIESAGKVVSDGRKRHIWRANVRQI